MFVATINVPGYLPMDDGPAVFESADDAWIYLANERVHAEDGLDIPQQTETVAELFDMSRSGGAGTVYGVTPGYEGSHDLGLAYNVWFEEES